MFHFLFSASDDSIDSLVAYTSVTIPAVYPTLLKEGTVPPVQVADINMLVFSE